MNKFGNKRKPSAYEQINVGEPDLMVIEGFKSNLVRTVLFWTSVTLSLGIVYIVTDWKKSLYLKCTHEKCPLDSSETVLLTDESGQEFAEQIVRPSPLVTTLTDHVYFMHKQIKYIWRPEQGTFSKLHGLDNEKCSKIYTHSQGLSSKEAEMAAILYGSNSIVVDVKPMWKLVMEEIRSPFYVYQLFIVLVWLVQLYYQFAICIFLFSVGSVSIQVYETRKQSLLLREKVQSESEVCLVRDDDIMTKPSTDLVPGDVIILPVGSTYQMECDAILISGNCTVDESMLTGESVPITKVSLAESPSVLYSNSKHKNNTLFCGTCVLYVQPTEDAHVKAIVLRTGYSTAKGELVRSILYPKNVNQQLRRDIIKCMVTFLFLGIPCMVYTGRVFSALNARLADTVIIVIDVATFLCPPLLPAVMTSINAHAQKRLRNRGIFCLNSSFINFAGGLDVVVFDKTGTLTEDTIDYQKAVVVDRGEFKMAAGPVEPDSPEKCHLFLTMACCHSLVEYNGTYHGDSLDLKMFEALKWSFKGSNDEGLFERPPDRIVGPREMGENSSLYGIVRQFPFESVLQRMSCVCIKQGSPMYKVLLKGAPEKVVSFCDPSTVPRDWETVLESYARDGLRVIAAAHRVLEDGDLKTILHMPREDLETEMTFDGFLIFANRLKDETGPALAELRSVDIRTIMATGDNMLTAVSVARNCGMIGEHDSVIQVEANVHTKPGLRPSECEQLVVKYKYAKLPGLSEQIKMNVKSDLIDEALIPMVDTIDSKSYHLCADGASFEAIRLCDTQLFERMVHKGTIFARMTPENKLKLIEELQNQGHQVGMCGDGANDCGALRAANAGISLSVAESSVASPFTYRDKNISCFPTLIKEGRATLAATFGSFKYQVSYCFVLLGAAMTLFWDGQKPSDAGYVFIDIILNILPPLVFGTTQASSVLTKRRPQRSLFAILPLFSTFSFVVIQVTIYVWAKQYLVQQAWYEPFKFDPTNVHRPAASYDQLTIISLNTMSYVIASIIFAPGEPFRKGFLSNKTYMLVVFINFSMIFFVTMYPAPDFILRWIKFKPVPSSDYKVLLFTISIVNFIICYTWEVLFVQRFVCDKMAARDTSRSSSRRFQVLERELDQDSDWPPLIGRTKSSEPKYSTTISIDEEETFNSKRRLPVWSEEDTGQDGGDAIELRQTAPRTFYTFSGTPRTSL